MRVIAGVWRSRPLATLADDATRPTGDRVREALFSMLNSRLGSFDGLFVLDLFAGTGALAFEALSRGAARAVLVENAPAACRAIEANIHALGANARLIRQDATMLPRAESPADLIFCDPPYGQGLATSALISARKMGWIAPSSWIAVETAQNETADVVDFTIETSRKFGKAAVHLLRPA